MAKGKVGDAGSLIDHISRLVAALRARDWATVYALAIDIFGMVTNPMAACAGPGFMAAGDDNPDSVADKLEAIATKAKADPAGFTWDWKTIVALLFQVLSIFLKQPPTPAPTPAPAQS